ncbi:MAG TPA: glycerol-3-phosphate dehydrogenase/oxidase [Nevskiaceae bacterium]|nr:glycerol-3-phosphate dehydrogenase/oxidase [Nevskiaceae bacterium]
MATDRLSALPARFDLVVIGGGITGAGVLREAVRLGLSVLLVERDDFASATSSASSKLVHGGLRYLSSGHWRLTLESVRERNRLLAEAPGLVEPQPFLLPVHGGAKPSRWLIQVGLFVYDLMAGRLRSRWIDADALCRLEPYVARENLKGAMAYEDARTDDARLVQRLIEDSRAAGATALNYVAVEDLVRDGDRVTGVVVRDALANAQRRIGADIVVNATGAWTRQFAPATVAAPNLRPLRGSHFVFPRERLPITHAVSWLHPRDHRPIFAYPWEGAVVYGTTDLDHDPRQLTAPRVTDDEAEYLFEGLAQRFPTLKLSRADAISTYAGVRPVVAGGAASPSAESRESALWSSPGLVSITGGKLTTFRVTARHVLAEAAKQLPRCAPQADAPAFDPASPPQMPGIDAAVLRRLAGRFGAACARLLDETPRDELVPIGDTPFTWAELRWSARYEQVHRLEDLLLRRTRLGLVCRDGGDEHLPRIRAIVQRERGWDDARWDAEEAAWHTAWLERHAPG